jgi:predicted ArsR family transcriptional regulator
MRVSRSEGRPQLRELVQRQARALGDPTRYEIFRYVADATSPVRIATLAAHLRFNPNAIRQHLAKLTEAGLVVEEVGTPATTGRPPLQYRVAPTAQGTWGSPGPYELLALLLLEVAETKDPRAAGAQAGRQVVSKYPSGTDAVDVLEGEMAGRGFEPRREVNGDLIELVLQRCPFEAAARAAPDVVCQIHLGLAEGVLAATDAGLRVRDLVTHDPHQGGCRLQLEPVPVALGDPRVARADAPPVP